jgi:hypothetical protein
MDYSKQQKLEAARALLHNVETGAPVDKKHMGPLKDGGLGELYKSYRDVMSREATEDKRPQP